MMRWCRRGDGGGGCKWCEREREGISSQLAGCSLGSIASAARGRVVVVERTGHRGSLEAERAGTHFGSTGALFHSTAAFFQSRPSVLRKSSRAELNRASPGEQFPLSPSRSVDPRISSRLPLNASSHPRCLFPSLPLRLSFHLRREPSDSQQQRPSTLRFWAGHPLAECGSAGLCTGSAHEATAEAESIDRRLLAHACLYYNSITRGSSPVFFTPNISGFDFPSRTSRILLGTPVTRATRRRNPESIKIFRQREEMRARLSMCRWGFFSSTFGCELAVRAEREQGF